MLLIAAYETEQHNKKMSGYGPGNDMASPGTELTSVCYEYSYPDTNCNSKNGM